MVFNGVLVFIQWLSKIQKSNSYHRKNLTSLNKTGQPRPMLSGGSTNLIEGAEFDLDLSGSFWYLVCSQKSNGFHQLSMGKIHGFSWENPWDLLGYMMVYPLVILEFDGNHGNHGPFSSINDDFPYTVT